MKGTVPSNALLVIEKKIDFLFLQPFFQCVGHLLGDPLSLFLTTFSEHVCESSCRWHLKTSFSLVSGFDSNEMDTLPRPPLPSITLPPLPVHLRGSLGHPTQARCCKTGCPGTPGPDVTKLCARKRLRWQQRIPLTERGFSLLCEGHPDPGNRCHKWGSQLAMTRSPSAPSLPHTTLCYLSTLPDMNIKWNHRMITNSKTSQRSWSYATYMNTIWIPETTEKCPSLP